MHLLQLGEEEIRAGIPIGRGRRLKPVVLWVRIPSRLQRVYNYIMENIWKGLFDNSAFLKRDYNTAARRRMAESGAAMPDGSFPIANRTDLENAIRSIGRASNPAAAKEHIKRRARALGLTELLPENWN